MSLNFNAWWIMGERPVEPLGPADKVRSVRHTSDINTMMAWSDPTTNRLELRQMGTTLTPASPNARTLNASLRHMWDMCEGVDEMAHVFYVDSAVARNVRHYPIGGVDSIVARPASYTRYDDGNKTPVVVPLDATWEYSQLSCAPGVPASVLKPNTPTWNPPEYRIEDWVKAKYQRYDWRPATYEQWDKTTSKYLRQRWIAPQYEVTRMEGKTQDAAPGSYRKEIRSFSHTGGPYYFTSTVTISMPWPHNYAPSDAEAKARAINYLAATYPYYFFTGAFSTFSVSYYNATTWRIFCRPEYMTGVFGSWVNVGTVWSYGAPLATSTERYVQLTAPKVETWVALANRPNGGSYLGYREYSPQTWLTDSNTAAGLWPGQQQRQKAGTGVWVDDGFVYAYTQPADTVTYRYYLDTPGYWSYVQDVRTDNPPANTASREYRFKASGYWETGTIYDTDSPPADTTTVRYVKVADGYWQARPTTIKTDSTLTNTATVRYIRIADGYWTRTYQPEVYPNSYYLSVGTESIAVINTTDGTLHYSVETDRHRSYAFNRNLIATAMGRGYRAGVAGLWVAGVNNWPLDEGHRQTLANDGGMGSDGVCLISGTTFGVLGTSRIGRVTSGGVFTDLGAHGLPIQTVHRGGKNGWSLVTLAGGTLAMVKVNFTSILVEEVVELFVGFSGNPDHADFTHVGIDLGYAIFIDPMDGWAKYIRLNFNNPDLYY